MGGSLASMTALYLVKSGLFDEKKARGSVVCVKVQKTQVRLVTFGEPRTGNVAYARSIESSLSFRFRVVHRNDFVSVQSSLEQEFQGD